MNNMDKEKKIYVYADFLSYSDVKIGTIFVSFSGGREIYAFEYDTDWLKQNNLLLDPDLMLFRGRHYLSGDKNIFGMFADSCPDRWGRKLLNRREEIRARECGERPRKLLESDYLLGVYDESRMGGLRFKTDPDGDFLSSDKECATPPWTSLRELEQASLAFEKDNDSVDEKWLRQLIAPGSSLGGARPKASVVAPNGSLWIAKFPSRHDDIDSGAWEMVVHDLASMCGLTVPEALTERFTDFGTTFLVKRFDRQLGKRIHFSSAMNMLGKTDGANAADGSSYLEIVSFIRANGARPEKDLEELWKRIVFSMNVSNTDDHFRNHGFLLSESGWILSPVYDVNPDMYGEFLSLNVNETDSAIDVDLAVDSARYYGIKSERARELSAEISRIVSQNWEKLAKRYGIKRGEIERMRPAFRYV